MPTYDYECDACGHKFELFQSISAPVEKKCPECGKLKLRRLFGTGAAVVFKGSGFYQTDYRSDSYKKGGRQGQAGERIEERLEVRIKVRIEIERTQEIVRKCQEHEEIFEKGMITNLRAFGRIGKCLAGRQIQILVCRKIFVDFLRSIRRCAQDCIRRQIDHRIVTVDDRIFQYSQHICKQARSIRSILGCTRQRALKDQPVGVRQKLIQQRNYMSGLCTQRP